MAITVLYVSVASEKGAKEPLSIINVAASPSPTSIVSKIYAKSWRRSFNIPSPPASLLRVKAKRPVEKVEWT